MRRNSGLAVTLEPRDGVALRRRRRAEDQQRQRHRKQRSTDGQIPVQYLRQRRQEPVERRRKSFLNNHN